MRRKRFCIFLRHHWYPTIAIAISIVAICFSLCHDGITVSFQTAFYTGMATIISIPTAIVIGWNIYSALGIQDEIKQFKSEIKQIETGVKARMDKYEKEANGKIDELKKERGILKLNTTQLNIGKDKGFAYFTIESNTNWNIYPNNTGNSINGLHVYPLNGEGNATITVEYDKVETENYQQSAGLVVQYTSYGTKQNSTVNVSRRHLP